LPFRRISVYTSVEGDDTLDLDEDCGPARLAKAGCVLVRPDMHIAWRANGMADDPAAEPLDVMSRILPLPI
jgi:2,4-dichlorophenol 6-monooxygenase